MSEAEQAGSLDRSWRVRVEVETALSKVVEAMVSGGRWGAYWNDGIVVECSVPVRADGDFSVWWKRRFVRMDDSHELPLSLILGRTSNSMTSYLLRSKIVGYATCASNSRRLRQLDNIARKRLDQLERWLNEHLARCYRIGDLSPEPDRTIAAAVSRRSAERRHRVPGRLPGDVTSHYPLLRDPEIFARFERELAAELLSG